MAGNLVSDPILAYFGPNWCPKTFVVGFTSIRCYTLLQAVIVRNYKEN